MAQGGSQAPTGTEPGSQGQPGNSLLQHMNFRGHEGEPVSQEQPEHILGKDSAKISTYTQRPTPAVIPVFIKGRPVIKKGND